MAQSYLILPYPDFFSAPLRTYVDEVASAAGRHIVFCDGRQVLPTIASAHVIEDSAGAAIIIGKTGLTRANYEPPVHDPWVAHEATHIMLHADGWPVSCHRTEFDSLSHETAQAVHNWLTDPVINVRLETLGFSLTLERSREIANTVAAVEMGIWSAHIAEGCMPILSALRLIVSFMLEPAVADNLKNQLCDVLRRNLPALYAEAEAILELLGQEDWKTAPGYASTAMKCLQLLGVNISNIDYRSITKFTPEECAAWAKENASPEASWD